MKMGQSSMLASKLLLSIGIIHLPFLNKVFYPKKLTMTPTAVRYIECSLAKEVNNQSLWNLRLGSQESMDVRTWNTIGFQQRDQQDSQDLINDTFWRLRTVSALRFIGTENHPEAAKLLSYDDEYYLRGYG